MRRLALVSCAILLASGSAAAGPRVAGTPSPALDRGLMVERAAVRGDGAIAIRAVAEGAWRPLVLVGPQQERAVVVDRAVGGHLQAAWLARHRYALWTSAGAGRATAGEAAGTVPGGAEAGWTLADPEVGGRIALLGAMDGPAGTGTVLASSLRLWLPAGAGWLTDDRLTWRWSALLERQGDRGEWAFAVGYHDRRARVLPGLLPTRDGPLAVAGGTAGFAADPARRVVVGWEFEGRFGVGAGTSLLDPRSTSLQLLGTLRWRLPIEPFEVSVGAGPGALEGVGAADVRALAAVRLAPETAAPPPDSDGDGVQDVLDACPDRPGVPSEQPLLRGCPEQPPDADGDAIPDEHDACPAAAGEATGDRRDHGCPRAIPAPPRAISEPPREAR